jgi:hypothetical protein
MKMPIVLLLSATSAGLAAFLLILSFPAVSTSLAVAGLLLIIVSVLSLIFMKPSRRTILLFGLILILCPTAGYVFSSQLWLASRHLYFAIHRRELLALNQLVLEGPNFLTIVERSVTRSHPGSIPTAKLEKALRLMDQTNVVLIDKYFDSVIYGVRSLSEDREWLIYEKGRRQSDPGPGEMMADEWSF